MHPTDSNSSNKSVHSSTPNSFQVTGRRPIRQEEKISPIPKEGNVSPIQRRLYNRKSKSGSEASESDSSSGCDDNESINAKLSRSLPSFDLSYAHRKNHSNAESIISGNADKSSQLISAKVCCVSTIVMAIIIGVLANAFRPQTEPNKILTIEKLQEHFPIQSEEVWNALESGIYEVKSFNKPSVFLLLYENRAEETVNQMLSNISKYATCILNENCEIQPVVLTSNDLSTTRARNDYGYLIDKYKPELEQKSVMVVKNLDQVPGEVAQVFHSMCDEISPLVGKTVFFFTIKTWTRNELHRTDLQTVEEILRSSWSDLEDDIFYPLFTRISNMVLRVVPEKL